MPPPRPIASGKELKPIELVDAAIERIERLTPLNGLWPVTLAIGVNGTKVAAGQPAMSVPLHWNADGLPIGTHFVARYGDEATLFRLAAQLEAARPPSAPRRPSVWV